MRSIALTLLILMALFLVPAGALADGLSWSISPGGTSSWNAGALIGSDIPIVSVMSSGPSLAITDGILNFNTVANNGSAWSWGAGGAFTVMGCIHGVTSGTCDGSINDHDVALITGAFSGTVSIVQAGMDGIAFGAIQGFIDQSVANHFGLSSNYFSVGTWSTTIQNLGTMPNNSPFSGAANSGGGIGTSSFVSVSEDWTVSFGFIFFGFAVAAFGLASRVGLLRPVGW